MSDELLETLNHRQRRFVEEYLEDHNSRRAALAAGYSETGITTQAIRLLRNATIQTIIEQNKVSMQERMQNHLVEALGVVVEIMNNPSSNSRDRLTAANSLMDRCGLKATDKLEIQGGLTNEHKYTIVQNLINDPDIADRIAEQFRNQHTRKPMPR